MPNNLLSPQFFKLSLHSHPTPPLTLISLSSLVSPYILSSLLLIYLTSLTAQQNPTKLSHPILKLPSPYSHSSHLILLPKSHSPPIMPVPYSPTLLLHSPSHNQSTLPLTLHCTPLLLSTLPITLPLASHSPRLTPTLRLIQQPPFHTSLSPPRTTLSPSL